jgi:hypothetical protein
MSIGSWNPQVEQTGNQYQIDIALLKKFIDISKNQSLENLNKLLSADEQQQHCKIMFLDQQDWSIAESLNDNEIELLMRFFTLAEQLPGWDSAAQSPVIYLGKILKKRGTGINKELVLWIKDNSDNKFLPHGPLL